VGGIDVVATGEAPVPLVAMAAAVFLFDVVLRVRLRKSRT
jgi:hypothetical protein